MNRLVLASGSPRRKQILEQIGLEFEILPSDVSEQIPPNGDPRQIAEDLALAKARWGGARVDDGIVIGADTIVVLDNHILGKPEDTEDARRILSLIAGRCHRVITGVALVEPSSKREFVSSEETLVWIRPLDDQSIEAYISTGEPMDKAGAYAVQGKGSVLVRRIEGCYFNVVGLPVGLLADMLSRFGVHVL